MAQTSIGASKIVASRAGITLEEFVRRREAGEKWCYGCKAWKPVGDFSKDASRFDGWMPLCRNCRSVAARARYKPKVGPRKYGPDPLPRRDGDKKQARQRVNALIQAGKIPPPRALPCTDCGHEWKFGDRRHEYDHYLGYDAENHLKIEAVCTLCHKKRDARKTHCKYGHELTPDNVIVSRKGARQCRECRRIYDRGRRDSTYWREYRRKRKEKLP